FFVEHTDNAGGEEVAEQACVVRSWNVTDEILGDGRNDACGAVGGSRYDTAASGVFFIHGHGPHVDPIHGSERIASSRFSQFLGESRRAAPHAKTAGENPLCCQAAFDAPLHRFPNFVNMSAYFRLCVPSLFIFEPDLPDREIVFAAKLQKLSGAGE